MAETLYPGTFCCGIEEKLTMNSDKRKNLDTLTYGICAMLFCAFSFVFLYCYQDDLLTVTQVVLSHGQTHYDRLIGATLITVVLMLLHVGVKRLWHNFSLLPGLSFYPSALCLGVLTGMRLEDGAYTFRSAIVWGVVLLVVYVAIVAVLRQMDIAVQSVMRHMPVACKWLVNIGLMVMSLLTIMCLCNNDKVWHARAHVEQCLMDDDLDGALATLKQVQESDSNLFMLRAYALSQKGELGERLFEQNVVAGSAALLPTDSIGTAFILYPVRDLFRNMGGMFSRPMPSMDYLEKLRKYGRAKTPVGDYLLCGYLLDKRLDAFVDNIGKYYTVNDSTPMPKHYREALLLYTHRHSSPKLVYKNNIIEADFQDYQKLEADTKNALERQVKLRDTFGNTYWYYYQYGK